MSNEQVWKDNISNESDIYSTSGNVHPKGHIENNSDNDSTLMIIRLNK
jgi:predicted nucleotidyltransferase